MENWLEILYKKLKKAQKKKKEIESSGKNDNNPNLLEISNILDELYFLEKLKVYCNYLSYSGIIHVDSMDHSDGEYKLMKEILNILEKEDYNNPCIRVYLLIKKIYENLNPKSIPPLNKNIPFKELEDELRALKDNFTPRELIDIYSFLTNYTIKCFNNKQPSYLKKIILLYSKILNLRYDTIKRDPLPLHSNVYRNVVILSLLIEDVNFFDELNTFGVKPKKFIAFTYSEEWTEMFIDYYRLKLSAKEREKYYVYCKALINFKKKDFEKAYKLIEPKKNIRGLYINLDIKILYLKVFYELSDMKEDKVDFIRESRVNINRKIATYRSMIDQETNNDSKIAYQKEYFISFLNAYRKLYNLQWNYRWVYTKKNKTFENRREELRETIDNIQFPFKSWFEEKFAAFN